MSKYIPHTPENMRICQFLQTGRPLLMYSVRHRLGLMDGHPLALRMILGTSLMRGVGRVPILVSPWLLCDTFTTN